MFNFKRLLLSVAVLGMLSSCVKEYEATTSSDDVKVFTDLKVSKDFNWMLSKQTQLAINVLPGSKTAQELEGKSISLLDENYATITVASIHDSKAEISTNLPVEVSKLYLFIPFTGSLQELNSFGVQSITMNAVPTNFTGSTKQFRTVGRVTCTSGCSRTISNTVNDITVSNNETVCLTGTLNGNLTIKNGGKLRICGTAKITNFNVNGNLEAYIEVSENGTLEYNGHLNLNTKTYVTNYGTVNISGGLNINNIASFTNYKTTNVPTVNINSGGKLETSGEFNVKDGDLNNNNILNNNGTIKVDKGRFTNNSSGTLVNNCKIEVATSDFTNNGTFYNNSYLKVNNGTYILNSSTNNYYGSASQVSTKHFTWNSAKITATGDKSLIKVADKTVINSGASVAGALDVCDNNGIETKYSSFGPNVTYCGTVYIPKTTCNTEGFGKPIIIDTDGDGSPDTEDAYPNDALRAYNINLPSSGYTLNAYEDLWPSRGDYDFNDVVIKSKIKYVTNANNKAVEANVEVVLTAVDGGLHNGLALQFVQSQVSGAKTIFKTVSTQFISSTTGKEAKLDKVANAIVISQDLYKTQTKYYTNTGDGPSATPDTLRFSIKFNTAVAQPSSLIPDFFIFRSDNRTYEIHLPGYPATSAMNTKYFGTFDDKSSPESNSWYLTNTNLPWGMQLSTSTVDFKVPRSKVSILVAYPSFAAWAQSGGAKSTDWVKTPNVKNVITIK